MLLVSFQLGLCLGVVLAPISSVRAFGGFNEQIFFGRLLAVLPDMYISSA